jgi:DNA-binding CsgD family transcriptional regulator
MTARVSSPIFIGRARELAALSDALDRAEGGNPSCVLIGGEAGIGKSRLLSEFAAYARDRAVIILEGDCVSLGSDEGLPFAPIAEVLRGLAGRLDAATLGELLDSATVELSRLAPELAGPAPRTVLSKTQSAWGQTRLFEGLLTLMARLSERSPVVMILEDLHWADHSSRDIVSFMVRNVRTERLCVVGTYRTDELHRRHPLRRWLAEIKRVPRVERLNLVPFDSGELQSQLIAIQGGPLDRALVETIARRSEGNPFFAEELLAAAVGGDANQLPDTLREVLLTRVASLSDPGQRLLEVAAVSGTSVDDALLARVVENGETPLAEGLRELISSHLLVEVGSNGPAYAFRHALLQEAVYEDLLPGERRQLHAAFAAALGEIPVPTGAARATHFSAIAHHASAANDLPLALRTWIEAARGLSDAYAFAEAARAYERALDLWDTVPEASRPGEIDEVQLLYETSMALDDGGEPHQAVEYARRAVDRFDRAVDPGRAAKLLQRLASALESSGDGAMGAASRDDAVALVTGNPPSADGAWVLAELAYRTWSLGGYGRARDIARRAIADARKVGARDTEGFALSTLGSSLAVMGDCERGLPMLRESLARTREGGGGDVLVWVTLASTLLDCDQPAEALNAALEGYEWAKQNGMFRTPGGYLGLLAGHVLTELGRWDEAKALFDEFGAGNPTGFQRVSHATYSGCLAVRAGRDDAARLLKIGTEEEAGLAGDAGDTGRLFGGLIELALGEHRIDDARTAALQGLGWLDGTDDVRYRSRLLQLAIRIESEAAAIARAARDTRAEERAVSAGLDRLAALRELIGTIAMPESPVFAEAMGNAVLGEAEATRLLGRSDPNAWAAAADSFGERHWPYERAWCRYRQVEATLAMKGSRADAARGLGEAWSICSQLGARPLREAIEALARAARLELPVGRSEAAATSVPSGHPAVADRFRLTAREREVLELLAAGYTNRRIAEALYISQNTAGVHVSNIIGKLGVTNRVEAAAVALRLNLVETMAQPGGSNR